MDKTNAVSENQLSSLFSTGLAGRHIHAIGAGGIGISAMLQLAQARGAHVTGCDQAATTMSRLLASQGIPIRQGHDPAHIVEGGRSVDLVVSTPAVAALDPNQAELAAAREQGIPVVDWQELLGYLMRGFVGISVAGVHGKGSTAALLGALAIAGGLDPTVEVGAVVPGWGSNLRMGQGRHFINEADEWNYNFLHYHPRIVVLTAIEHDHPEFYQSYAEIRDAFLRFLAGMDTAQHQGDTLGPPSPVLILNADNSGCLDVLNQLGPNWPGVVRTFGIEAVEADIRATQIEVANETSFRLWLHGQDLGLVRLRMTGAHSVANAIAAVAAADLIGVPAEVIVPTLSAFGGLRRRFEISEDANGVTYVDDYAHHPHAVALTLETARLRFPDRRLIAVFQPTLFTRLHRFLESFSAAFDLADQIVIVEIQPSRERDTGLIHGHDLVRAIQARPAFAGHASSVVYGGDFEATVTTLRPLLRPSDVLVVMGSGPVNQIIPPLRDTPGQTITSR